MRGPVTALALQTTAVHLVDCETVQDAVDLTGKVSLVDEGGFSALEIRPLHG